jgi:hypothetical protein
MGCTSGKAPQPNSASAKSSKNTLLATRVLPADQKLPEVQSNTVKVAEIHPDAEICAGPPVEAEIEISADAVQVVATAAKDNLAKKAPMDVVPLVDASESVEPVTVDAAGDIKSSTAVAVESAPKNLIDDKPKHAVVDAQPTLVSATPEREEAKDEIVAAVPTFGEVRTTPPKMSAEQTSPTRKERKVCC